LLAQLLIAGGNKFVVQVAEMCWQQVSGCPVLDNVCTAPVSFNLSAEIRSVGTYFTYECFFDKRALSL
jgi:hypothetical protein